ncbi:nucleotidyl transferase AbiEii/AbiGii toxin family protein [Thermosulfurimonas sp. F29]|uniref:nucleotidyl transferase AbiEii/AbiGii toxin family protein n=1 Tax=Thermosulfurimonas sp. F29 TaxID=2867247 RepID=UPI001C832002|nr:nucleotidyl transferase AbiEii/AbiGii toxin family protein [Thermosulfurimonas sp. F29]MBX6423437.1 nucleotidyl transferase AbiEii/AbiGii toxin family protein [Thermosulfurimonas sp. F29]
MDRVSAESQVRQQAIARLQKEVLKVSWRLAQHIVEWKLTGGTALTLFHGFTHRFSEDLDFFFDLSPDEIKEIIVMWERELHHSLDCAITEFAVQEKGSSFVSRRIVEFSSSNESIIVDFVSDPFPGLFPKEIKKGTFLDMDMMESKGNFVFRVDPVVAIGVKKLWAFHTSMVERLPPRSKDIVDIYVLGTSALDMVSLLDEYKRLFPDFPIENILLFARNIVRQIDYSNILNLNISIEEMFKWYEERVPSIIALFQCDLDEIQDQKQRESKIKSRTFRIRYPGP